jgi:hypothetical protein
MRIDDTQKTPRADTIKLLGISQSHFHRLQSAGVFAPVVRGRYDLKEVIKAWAKYHADGRSAGDAAEEKKLLTIAQRKRIELDMAERKRELIPLPDAQAAFNESMIIVASQLDALPGRAAGELAGMNDPAMIRAWLFEETRRIRNAAAQHLETFAADPTGGSAAVTATAEDSRPVG